MKDIEKLISPLIEQQFPSIYRDEGATFVTFVKTYFEWLEQTNNVAYDSRRLPEYRDIDTTLDRFVDEFRKKYMHGIPKDIAADKRLLQKHIKEVYSSKGTARGLELLFRILFNEDINVYIPGGDILRASDGQWFVPKYLELEYNLNTKQYIGKTITGRVSGATAFVDDYKTYSISGNLYEILYISNIKGTFVPSEEIINDDIIDALDIDVLQSPRIKGSLNQISMTSSDSGFSLGEVLNVVGNGISGQVVVTGLTDSDGVSAVKLYNSGVGYIDGSSVTLVSTVDSSRDAAGTISFAGHGVADGFFKNTRGFLSSDKYIHDNYYYQEYSYEVQALTAFERYSGILRDLWHPAGMEKFGRTLVQEIAVSRGTTLEALIDYIETLYLTSTSTFLTTSTGITTSAFTETAKATAFATEYLTTAAFDTTFITKRDTSKNTTYNTATSKNTTTTYNTLITTATAFDTDISTTVLTDTTYVGEAVASTQTSKSTDTAFQTNKSTTASTNYLTNTALLTSTKYSTLLFATPTTYQTSRNTNFITTTTFDVNKTADTEISTSGYGSGFVNRKAAEADAASFGFDIRPPELGGDCEFSNEEIEGEWIWRCSKVSTVSETTKVATSRETATTFVATTFGTIYDTSGGSTKETSLSTSTVYNTLTTFNTTFNTSYDTKQSTTTKFNTDTLKTTNITTGTLPSTATTTSFFAGTEIKTTTVYLTAYATKVATTTAYATSKDTTIDTKKFAATTFMTNVLTTINTVYETSAETKFTTFYNTKFQEISFDTTLDTDVTTNVTTLTNKSTDIITKFATSRPTEILTYFLTGEALTTVATSYATDKDTKIATDTFKATTLATKYSTSILTEIGTSSSTNTTTEYEKDTTYRTATYTNSALETNLVTSTVVGQTSTTVLTEYDTSLETKLSTDTNTTVTQDTTINTKFYTDTVFNQTGTVLNATQYITAISTAYETIRSTTTAINTSSATAYVTVVDIDTIFDTVIETVLNTAPPPPPPPEIVAFFGGTNGLLLRNDTETVSSGWAAPTTPPPSYGGQLLCIANNGSRIVVGGSNGFVSVSTDKGETWVNGTIPSFASAFRDVESIAFGNGVFVAVGTNGSVASSTDGVTWTSRTGTLTGSMIGRVVFGAGCFIVTGTGNTAMRSTDGINWSSVSLGLPTGGAFDSPEALIWTGTKFVAAALNTQNISTSDDGITWVVVTVPKRGTGSYYNGIAYDPTIGLIITESGGYYLHGDPTLTTFTQRQISGHAGFESNAIAYGGKIMVSDQTNSRFSESSNGINWTIVNIGNGSDYALFGEALVITPGG